MSGGQLIFGGSQSLTMTVNEHELVLPEVSVATLVTVLVPFGKIVPEGGVETRDCRAQLSVAVTVKKTSAEHWPGSLHTVKSGEQLIFGGSASLTTTLNVQLDPVVLVLVILVVPTGKNEPDGGELVTRPHPPLLVGAG